MTYLMYAPEEEENGRKRERRKTQMIASHAGRRGERQKEGTKENADDRITQGQKRQG
jgi:hypothetical protein